jgi:hypothetical protein
MWGSRLEWPGPNPDVYVNVLILYQKTDISDLRITAILDSISATLDGYATRSKVSRDRLPGESKPDAAGAASGTRL